MVAQQLTTATAFWTWYRLRKHVQMQVQAVHPVKSAWTLLLLFITIVLSLGVLSLIPVVDVLGTSVLAGAAAVLCRWTSRLVSALGFRGGVRGVIATVVLGRLCATVAKDAAWVGVERRDTGHKDGEEDK